MPPESVPGTIDPAAGLHKATILAEALPALQELAGATIVVKYGGNAMVDDELKKAFAADMVFLRACGMHPRRRARRRTADLGDAEKSSASKGNSRAASGSPPGGDGCRPDGSLRSGGS